MTQTGGIALLIAWSIFVVLLGILAWLVLRHSRHLPDRSRLPQTPSPGEGPVRERRSPGG